MGGITSHADMIARGGPSADIGMSTIKQRRLALPISCYEELNVGSCVPFYFCPRSIMLYVIHCANNPELTFRGGQGSIVHIEADLRAVVSWAEREGYRWAFSLSNAGARYAQFHNDLSKLGHIDWDAVASNRFSSQDFTPSGNLVKESKQAEFLVEDFFDWSLVQRIGVASPSASDQVRQALRDTCHQPTVSVQPDWYF